MMKEHTKVVRMALDQAATQMSQCLRLLDGDEEFKAAFEQVRQALAVLDAGGQCGVAMENPGRTQQ
jgi:hypothetical protein